MTLSIGAATDYLYGLAQQAVDGVTVNGDPVVAVDGWPDELTFGMFVVGLERPPPDGIGSTADSVLRKTMGGYCVEQDYTIPCYIDVRVGGSVQKTARDAAEALLNSFGALFAADPSLGGVLTGGSAQITTITETPLNVGTAAEPGRRQVISFGVRCTNVSDLTA